MPSASLRTCCGSAGAAPAGAAAAARSGVVGLTFVEILDHQAALAVDPLGLLDDRFDHAGPLRVDSRLQLAGVEVRELERADLVANVRQRRATLAREARRPAHRRRDLLGPGVD